jgi:type I restriction enzyme M protein
MANDRLSSTKLDAILKGSKHRLTLFRAEEVQELEQRIIEKDGKFVAECLVRKKQVQLKPEEVVRQLLLGRLAEDYGYLLEDMKLEYPIRFGRDNSKRADIVIFDKDRPTAEYIIIEVKKPNAKDGKGQLKSYCHATGAPIAVWSNGDEISYYNRKDPNHFSDLMDVPRADVTLEEFLEDDFTWKHLVYLDKVLVENKSIKALILEMEDEVLANAGVDVFEEVFKLIFTKLFDEASSRSNKQTLDDYLNNKFPNGFYSNFKENRQALIEFDDSGFRQLRFKNKGQSPLDLKTKIQSLFDEAKDQWVGVFPDESKIELTPSHLGICVSGLESVKLFNSNLQVIDEAFEYLVNKSSKGEKGQYFTPRHVIDMCVKMLNPHRGEYMIDTAAGSCGFPVHTVFHLTGHLFKNAEISDEYKTDVLRVFGIDFDERAVRVSRTLNLIAGDGQTNVLHLNTLDYNSWDEVIKDTNWATTYGAGFKRLKRLQSKGRQNQLFKFDVLMANPPFAGDIKEPNILSNYDLGFDGNDKQRNKVGRDILFIERNLDFVRPGGRLAIVLPQGRFNNSNDDHIRNFIAERARILAVVGLHANTFKPHTGTKTSVLFLQKWNDDESDSCYFCPKVEDYPIFFAVSEEGGKDNSGEYIFTLSENGRRRIDRFGHFILHHDLHNHGGDLTDGIAEAFIDFAHEQDFGFVGEK